MKGLSLPINVIVIIAIAVLVLVVMAAFFGGYFGGAAISVQRDRALDEACNKFRSIYNCAIGSMDNVVVKHQDTGDSAPKDYSLIQLCELRSYNTQGSHTSGQINECAQRCNCPVQS